MRRRGDVGGGESDGAAQVAAVLHHAGDGERVAQQSRGILQRALCQQRADAAGGHARAAMLQQLVHRHADAVALAVGAQGVRIAAALAAEGKVTRLFWKKAWQKTLNKKQKRTVSDRSGSLFIRNR